MAAGTGEMFPALLGNDSQGAVPADMVNDGLWFNYGVYLHNAPSKMVGLGVSRPTLEGFVRRRLVQLPNFRVSERRDVVEPVFDRLSGRVRPVFASDQKMVWMTGKQSKPRIWWLIPAVAGHQAPNGLMQLVPQNLRRSRSLSTLAMSRAAIVSSPNI